MSDLVLDDKTKTAIRCIAEATSLLFTARDRALKPLMEPLEGALDIGIEHGNCWWYDDSRDANSLETMIKNVETVHKYLEQATDGVEKARDYLYTVRDGVGRVER